MSKRSKAQRKQRREEDLNTTAKQVHTLELAALKLAGLEREAEDLKRKIESLHMHLTTEGQQ